MSEKTIFEKIIDREVPAHVIYEDDRYIAILDIFPKSPGHTLLITKTVYPWVLDVPDFAEYWEIAGRIGRHLQEKLDATYISFQTFGIDVPHAHIHIVPFYSSTEHSERSQSTKEQLQTLYEKLHTKSLNPW